ncbi:GNAT family N-acetyltransferase [Clostridium bovifaecis]|uniref:GNAT family N-acetyltransferase n=1 Tax=Clostridium bovifaecis TaxID=2184719 RepID=A0A6I6ER11_9CLOT|nr:GNAT family N-acetyltransferase [Clostridium bovifaecis]
MGKILNTHIEGYSLRIAEEKDVPLILSFIKELASYEKMLEEVVATESILKGSLFDTKAAEVIIGEYEEEPVSFALFFHNFSTFLGKPGLYLEDLYVKPEARGKGLGKTLLTYLASLAKERGCGRFDWSCLDWNDSSIKFYRQMGAKPLDEWTGYRLTGESLENAAKEFLITNKLKNI